MLDLISQIATGQMKWENAQKHVETAGLPCRLPEFHQMVGESKSTLRDHGNQIRRVTSRDSTSSLRHITYETIVRLERR